MINVSKRKVEDIYLSLKLKIHKLDDLLFISNLYDDSGNLKPMFKNNIAQIYYQSKIEEYCIQRYQIIIEELGKNEKKDNFEKFQNIFKRKNENKMDLLRKRIDDFFKQKQNHKDINFINQFLKDYWEYNQNKTDFNLYHKLDEILTNFTKEEEFNNIWSEVIISIFEKCDNKDNKEGFIQKIISNIGKYKKINSKLSDLLKLGKNKKIETLETVINKVWFNQNFSSKIEYIIETKRKYKELESLEINDLIAEIKESNEEISIKLFYFLFCINLFKKEICQKISIIQKELSPLEKLVKKAYIIDFQKIKLIKNARLNEKDMLKFVKISLYNFCFQVFEPKDPIKKWFNSMKEIYEEAIELNKDFIDKFLTSLLANICLLEFQTQKNIWKKFLLSFDWIQKAIDCISEEVYQKMILLLLYQLPCQFLDSNKMLSKAMSKIEKNKEISILCYKYFKFKEKMERFKHILLYLNNNSLFQEEKIMSFFLFFIVLIKNLKNKEKVKEEILKMTGFFSQFLYLEHKVSKLNENLGENYFKIDTEKNIDNAFKGDSEIMLIISEKDNNKKTLFEIKKKKYLLKGFILPGNFSSSLYIRVNFYLHLYYDIKKRNYFNNFDFIKDKKVIFVFHKRGKPEHQKDEISLMSWFLNIPNYEFQKNYYPFLFDVLQDFPLNLLIFQKKLENFINQFNLQEEFKKFLDSLNEKDMTKILEECQRLPNSELTKDIQNIK